jgi:phospholipase/carboxylesterase
LTRSTADSLVILLHGVGSSGANMMALAEMWRACLPMAVFAAPDAPLAFDQGAGRQWFSISGVTAQNRSERIVSARPGFDRVVRAEIERNGFADRLDRVALVGFSQGSVMLLDAVATGRFPVAAAVAFAGRLATPGPFVPGSRPKLLLVHGDSDNVVPSIEMERARSALGSAGFAVEAHLLPNVGHAIVAEAASLAGDFIQSSFAGEPVR